MVAVKLPRVVFKFGRNERLERPMPSLAELALLARDGSLALMIHDGRYIDSKTGVLGDVRVVNELHKKVINVVTLRENR